MSIIIHFIAVLLNLYNSSSGYVAPLRAMVPRYLTKQEAIKQSFAAKLAETQYVKINLLLGLAYEESRYQPRATSRMEGGQRMADMPTWSEKPDNVRGPYFCGVTQAEAGMSWEKCLELRDVFVAYATTAKELKVWLRYSHGDIEKALGGYGCGKVGADNPSICGVHKPGDVPYPDRVLYRARLLKEALGSPTS